MIFNWPKPKQREVPVYKTFPLVRGMTLDIWRKRDDLRGWLMKLWDEPNFQGLLDAIRNAAPREIAGEASYQLGVREGYFRAMDNLLLATQPPPQPEPEVEITYGAGVELDNG